MNAAGIKVSASKWIGGFKTDGMGIQELLLVNVVISVLAGVLAYASIRHYIPEFMASKKNLYGVDQCKAWKNHVPEPMGVIAAAVYLVSIFLFIPFPFYEWLNECVKSGEASPFPYTRLLAMLAGVVSICTAILLGFADDMLDLRWRHKLLLPTLSALPLMLVYFISKNPTAMLLPRVLSDRLGVTYLDFGPLFYVYMLMLVIFSTNSINIIAGINGVEVGQALVIASSVALFNGVQIYRLASDPTVVWHHALSLCFLLPFIACSLALFALNKYPAEVFVGDTYCYWAGMTLAVVAITGGFSKTLLLFLVPQILNFLYSVPQLFNWIPCPRHRMPSFNPKTGLVEMSVTQFDPQRLGVLGRLTYRVLSSLRLVHYREVEKGDEKMVEMSNLTILNFILKLCGPLHEWTLTKTFLGFQCACSAMAFVLRFYCANLLYDTVQ